MDLNVITILSITAPLLAWIPVAGKDQKTGEVGARPELLLAVGALSSVPVVLMRLMDLIPAPTLAYATAHAYFRGLLIDGIGGIMIPLAVLSVTFRLLGRPDDPRTLTRRASLIILAYCLVDGLFIELTGSETTSLMGSLARSIPKLVLAPLWGILFSSAAPEGRRTGTIAATAVIAAAFCGLVSFLIRLDRPGFAIAAALAAVGVAVVFRPGAFSISGAAAAEINPKGEAAKVPKSADRRPPAQPVYRLMKEGRYAEARNTAEQLLERYSDLYLFTWHALLRWVNGEKAYKSIFLERYKALGEKGQDRFMFHLEEYMGCYASQIAVWIAQESMKIARQPAQVLAS